VAAGRDHDDTVGPAALQQAQVVAVAGGECHQHLSAVRDPVERFLLEEDAKAGVPTRVVKGAKDVSSESLTMGGDVAQLADRLEAVERRQKLILTLLAVIGLLALAWPLVVAAFLPDLKGQKGTTPPINLPSDDPTSRPTRF